MAFNNNQFQASLERFTASLPDAASSFFRNGVRLVPQKVPRAAMGMYRRGLGHIAHLLAADPESLAYWKIFLLYDGLILGPFPKERAFFDVIRERVGLFLSGQWDSLFSDHFQYRDPSARPTAVTPLLDDPLDAKAAGSEGTAAPSTQPEPY